VILNGTALDEKYVTHEAHEDFYPEDFPNAVELPGQPFRAHIALARQHDRMHVRDARPRGARREFAQPFFGHIHRVVGHLKVSRCTLTAASERKDGPNSALSSLPQVKRAIDSNALVSL